MAAVREVHAENGVAGLQHRHVDGHVRLRAGVRLDVGVVCAEDLLGAIDGQRLGDVDELAAAVVALARIAFGVLVGEDAARRLQDRRAHEVLRRDEFESFFLAMQLVADRFGNFRIGVRQSGRRPRVRRPKIFSLGVLSGKNGHPQIIPTERTMSPSIEISRKGAERVRRGHPWIYRSDVERGEAEPGDLVRVTVGARPLGWAFWSTTSQIALRFVSRDPHDTPPDERAFLAERLRAAIAYRDRLEIDASACRLVHGEADRLPGLIVDRYGDYLVLQTLTQATDRRLNVIVELLVEILSPAGVLARNDPKVRALEGLTEEIKVLHGAIPDRVALREGPITLSVDLAGGQKTGAFLDQRENHAAAARYASGRALDGFTYQGGFALAMAPRADSVLALDSSEAAVRATRANAAANALSNVEVREANVFDELRDLDQAGARFDTIVLDPPAFARNRAAVERALAGYKEINLRALRLLETGGHLITCSCSYNVNESMFLTMLQEAAADAHATVVLVEKRTQARDHPMLLNVPETYYLKCFVLRRVA